MAVGWFPAQPDGRPTTMRALVRPGASWWVRAATPRRERPGTPGLGAAAIVLVGVLVITALLLVWAPLGIAAGVGALGGFVLWLRAVMRDTVMAPTWSVHGQPIAGEGFALLEDIDARFAYAEKHIRELPTGIHWRDVDEDVRALLWEAAEHAGKASAAAAEIYELRYAEPGTPQAALKTPLEEQRQAHLQVMRGVQREAEQLARVAGNAAAAARVALARTGSLDVVRSITPSRRAFAAAGALAEARTRLEALAQAWADVDDSTLLAAEKLRAELPRVEDEGSS